MAFLFFPERHLTQESVIGHKASPSKLEIECGPTCALALEAVFDRMQVRTSSDILHLNAFECSRDPPCF